MLEIKKIKSIINTTFFIFILICLLSSNAMSLVLTSFRNISEKENINQDDFTFLKTNYWAVLIGINDYPGNSGDLPYSISEISAFKSTLLNKGNWNESYIKMITDLEATHDNIIDTLEWLGDQETSKDISIVYLVGHGGKIDKNYSFSAYDSKVFDYELDSVFDSYDGRLVLIIDCCKSGGFTETVKGRGRVIMAACDKDELTYQYKPLKSGFFGYFLNLILEKITYTAEATFLIAAPLTYLYSVRLSRELEKDYIVRPKASDRTLGNVRIIKPGFLNFFRKESSFDLGLSSTEFDENEFWLL